VQVQCVPQLCVGTAVRFAVKIQVIQTLVFLGGMNMDGWMDQMMDGWTTMF
jgi:hypothetical protein